MIVLGVNGKLDGHDPAAALFVDGVLLAAVEEERLSRTRHAPGAMPSAATRWVLQAGGIALDDVDVVALGWDPRLQPGAPEPPGEDELLTLLVGRPRPGSRLALERVPHHTAHARYGWWHAPEATAVVVADGSGETISSSGWLVDGRELHLQWTEPYAASLGFAYEAATLFCGLRKYGEGKLMGLAGYGDPERLQGRSALGAPIVMPSAEPDDAHYLDILRAWLAHFEAATGRRRWRPADGPGAVLDHRHVAAAAQASLEADLADLVRRVAHPPGTAVLVGGVANNCRANGRVVALTGVPVTVPPSPGDAGVAVGAAAELVIRAGDDLAPPPAGWPAIGPPATTAGGAPVAALLGEAGIPFALADGDAMARVVDDLLAGGTAVWFRGRGEFGPRALGRRSFLASAGEQSARDRLNAIKRREPWRPLAPVVTAQTAALVLQDPSLGNPYMTVAGDVTPWACRHVPAAVHVDGSTRLQVLDPGIDPLLDRLLDLVEDATGAAALLNTSLNVGTPIVGTAEDALDLLHRTDATVAVLDECIVWSADAGWD